MPSAVVDDLWQELGLHARDYAAFCDAAFGRHLPHQPGSAMSAEAANTNRASLLLATLSYARRDESCGPTDLPLLFRVDHHLRIRDGNRYLADCGGRGDCFRVPGLVCLQHLEGTGKRSVVRGYRAFSDGRHAYGHAGYASAAGSGGAFWGGGLSGAHGGGDGGGADGGGGDGGGGT